MPGQTDSEKQQLGGYWTEPGRVTGRGLIWPAWQSTREERLLPNQGPILPEAKTQNVRGLK